MSLEATLKKFMAETAKSKVAVIIPLFGYWRDVDTGLDVETLKATLSRVYSNTHELYLFFVADVARIDEAVANVIVGAGQAGNVKGVTVESGSGYGDYIRDGLEAAWETQARFFIIINPWVMIQDGGLDNLIDRINRGDDAKIVSGKDLRPELAFSSIAEFDKYKTATPREIRDISFNFVGMERTTLDMVHFDEKIRTHEYLEKDLWQATYAKGFEVIISEHIPVFSFEVPWDELETTQEKGADKEYFISKWRFDPGVK